MFYGLRIQLVMTALLSNYLNLSKKSHILKTTNVLYVWSLKIARIPREGNLPVDSSQLIKGSDFCSEKKQNFKDK